MLLPGSDVALCLFTRDSRRYMSLFSQYLTFYVDMRILRSAGAVCVCLYDPFVVCGECSLSAEGRAW